MTSLALILLLVLKLPIARALCRIHIKKGGVYWVTYYDDGYSGHLVFAWSDMNLFRFLR